MKNKQTILVTGGAGFIGSALIRYIIANTNYKVINVDKLTYSGNLESLGSISNNTNYIFEQVDICDSAELERVFRENHPGWFSLNTLSNSAESQISCLLYTSPSPRD